MLRSKRGFEHTVPPEDHPRADTRGASGQTDRRKKSRSCSSRRWPLHASPLSATNSPFVGAFWSYYTSHLGLKGNPEKLKTVQSLVFKSLAAYPEKRAKGKPEHLNAGPEVLKGEQRLLPLAFGGCIFEGNAGAFKWLWVKNRCPKWNPGKWKHERKPAVPWWFNFDPFPNNNGAVRRFTTIFVASAIRDPPPPRRKSLCFYKGDQKESKQCPIWTHTRSPPQKKQPSEERGGLSHNQKLAEPTM